MKENNIVQPERKPTHFIEVYAGTLTKQTHQTSLLSFRLLDYALRGTSYPIETIAIWKIYPKQ